MSNLRLFIYFLKFYSGVSRWYEVGQEWCDPPLNQRQKKKNWTYGCVFSAARQKKVKGVEHWGRRIESSRALGVQNELKAYLDNLVRL